VRGTVRESESADRAPHPDPLPVKNGEREQWSIATAPQTNLIPLWCGAGPHEPPGRATARPMINSAISGEAFPDVATLIRATNGGQRETSIEEVANLPAEEHRAGEVPRVSLRSPRGYACRRRRGW
jgi:hypothetical protein